MKAIITALVLTLATSASAKGPARDKVTCEIDTIRQGHRVRLDPKDYSARQAVAIVTVVNKVGGNAFAVCGLETAETTK